MKLRISSDGTPHGTHVYGYNKKGEMELVEGVTQIEWTCDVGRVAAVATITVLKVPITAESSLKRSDLKIQGDDDDVPF